MDKKGEISKEGPKGRLEKMPPVKEEKKDTSVFGGKKYVPQEVGRQWVRRPELFKATGIPEAKRLKIWQELSKNWGYFIEQGELDKPLEKLKMERYRAKTEIQRKEIEEKIKILEKAR